jgi:hypothetical protein
MSLAMYAAPFNNDNDNNENNIYNYQSNETPISKKRNLHNKTQKKNDYNSQKVNAVLESIHKNSGEENDLGDFQPIAPPTSVGVENTKLKENFSNNSNSPSISNINNNNNNIPSNINETDEIDLKNLQDNFLNDKAVEKYYQNLIPNYNQGINYQNKSEHNKPYYPINFNNSTSNSITDVSHSENYKTLVEKLNYMINLLEEQQDEKTNNVTEEVVLYSFLGIFIIFIVDSFARVGKYVR